MALANLDSENVKQRLRRAVDQELPLIDEIRKQVRNLKFVISKVLTKDMIKTHCEDFNGRPVIRDQILIEALSRLQLGKDPFMAKDNQDAKFVLLEASHLNLQEKVKSFFNLSVYKKYVDFEK